MSLRIEKQSHICQKHMANGAKKLNDAKLAAGLGGLVLDGAVLGDFFGSGNVTLSCSYAFFQEENKCSL